MTFGAFEQVLRRMVGLKFPPVSYQSHWETLKRIPEPVLQAAVTRCMAAQSDFPTPRELLVYCDLVSPPVAAGGLDENRAVDLPEPVEFSIPQSSQRVRVTKEWRYDHEPCGDEGWLSFWCAPPGVKAPAPWWTPRACERRGEHSPHEWVGHCPCRETNPTIQRRKAARAKFASAEPAERRRSA